MIDSDLNMNKYTISHLQASTFFRTGHVNRMYVYKLTAKFECSQCKFVSKASVDTEFLFNFIGRAHASKAMSAKVGI